MPSTVACGRVDELAVAQEVDLLRRERASTGAPAARRSGRGGGSARTGPSPAASRSSSSSHGGEEVGLGLEPVGPQVGPVGVGPVDGVPQHGDSRASGTAARSRPGPGGRSGRTACSRPGAARGGAVEERLVLVPAPHPLLGAVGVAGSRRPRRRLPSSSNRKNFGSLTDDRKSCGWVASAACSAVGAGLRRADDEEVGEGHGQPASSPARPSNGRTPSPTSRASSTWGWPERMTWSNPMLVVLGDALRHLVVAADEGGPRPAAHEPEPGPEVGGDDQVLAPPAVEGEHPLLPDRLLPGEAAEGLGHHVRGHGVEQAVGHGPGVRRLGDGR